jgi:hypothetical protein
VIDVSPVLLAHGRLVPLYPDSKHPWLRSLKDGASNDPAKIAKWEQNKPGCGWGMRIASDELIVLDLEPPGKGSFAGGVRMTDWLECEAGRRLPDGPIATTQSGGQHRYFTLPPAFRGLVRNWTRVFPGIDIRVKGGLVVIPPSSGRMWIESPDDLAISELPTWFCQLMLQKRGLTTRTPAEKRPNVSCSAPTYTFSDRQERKSASVQIVREPIPTRLRFRLRKSGDFVGLWNRTRRLSDETNSSYEFALAVYAFLRGLTHGQVATLITAWWAKHSIQGKLDRLDRKIIPNAWDATRGDVEAFQAQREAKTAGKTRNRILAYISQHGPATPAQVAAALSIRRKSANMAMIRLTRTGKLQTAKAGAYTTNTPQPTTRKHTDFVTVETLYTSELVNTLARRRPGASVITPLAVERPNSPREIAA